MFNIKIILAVTLFIALGVAIYAIANVKPTSPVSKVMIKESTASNEKDTDSVFGKLDKTDKTTSNDKSSSTNPSPSTSNPLEKDINGLDKQFDDLNISDL